MVGLASPLSIMTANLHLFGGLGLIGPGKAETPLYLKDQERLEAFVHYVERERPKVLALQEVWDPAHQRYLVERLEYLYPHSLVTPWEKGVPKVVSTISRVFHIKQERVEAWAQKLVVRLAQNHYQASHSFLLSALEKVIPEDWATRFFQMLLGVQHFWGAGLLFLSQYPIERMSSGFEHHPVSADLERFANKGVQKATIEHPDMGPITFFNTHLQEGHSKRAIAARMEQIRNLAQLKSKTDFPRIILGDFNVERDAGRPPVAGERRYRPRFSAEYKGMREILDLKDAYRIHFDELAKHPGHTYRHGIFARRMGVPDTTKEQRLTIDYVLHDRNFEPLLAGVTPENEFMLDRTTPLSDHRPLSVVLVRRQFNSGPNRTDALGDEGATQS